MLKVWNSETRSKQLLKVKENLTCCVDVWVFVSLLYHVMLVNQAYCDCACVIACVQKVNIDSGGERETDRYVVMEKKP